MKKRFTEAQIVGFLRDADAGNPVKDLCRKRGFSDASYYLWRSRVRRRERVRRQSGCLFGYAVWIQQFTELVIVGSVEIV